MQITPKALFAASALAIVGLGSALALDAYASPQSIAGVSPFPASNPVMNLTVTDSTLIAALAQGDVVAGPGAFTFPNSSASNQDLLFPRPSGVGGSDDTAYLTVVNRCPSATIVISEGTTNIFSIPPGQVATGVVRIYNGGSPVRASIIGAGSIDYAWVARRR